MKKGKFSFIESGILLIVLGIVLIAISFDIIMLHLSPSTDIKLCSNDIMYENENVTLTITDPIGIGYYDTSVGIYPELSDNAKEYSRGYMVTLSDDDSEFGNRIILVETSSMKYKKIMDKYLLKEIDSINFTVVGKLNVMDENRRVDSFNNYISKNKCTIENMNEKLVPYYVVINYPVDEYMEFICGVLFCITGIVFCILHFVKKKDNAWINKNSVWKCIDIKKSRWYHHNINKA